ncbi:TetR/AcrR family transcriptional regulator [Hymenobacter busanensis]|uniref:TetR/AcrR family transcriptional regulator n=1 Tax=Hymenobacter busanensis TaxID=2607656 RepID=A0A7L4ZTB8_9BACT|nr:TetR/AcrR family transcriptional regulator [Hymenobacter busanensis]KAA9327634.1 TetR/AcrR family transcriptional regulator [Hymenobacter busanensis]QHJ06026.1 TetR family transcriptional regulator [Hymenobacter busanensis]
MLPPASATAFDTRTRILNLAEELLLARGFNAFSYQHIAKELAVKSAAIHYHYPGKEDLGVAIIRRQLLRLRKWRGLPRVTELTPAQQFEALVDVYHTRAATGQQVCFFGALAAEFQTLPAAMQQELRTLNVELTEWLAGVLAAGRANQTLHFRGHPVSKAAQVLTTLAGALQVARVHDEQQYQRIVAQVRAELLEPS